MNKKSILSIDEGTKLFLIQDPTININVSRDKACVKLDIDYEFSSSILYGFIFKLEGKKLPMQKALYINSEEESKETRYKESILDLYISDGEFIYNGSYYKMVN